MVRGVWLRAFLAAGRAAVLYLLLAPRRMLAAW